MTPAARTTAQNRRIWGLLRDLQAGAGIGKDDAEDILRDIVRDVSGQESTRSLSAGDADQVIARLRARVQNRGRDDRFGEGKKISARQQAALSQIQEALDMTPPGYQSFCRRTIGSPWPQTVEQGIKVYEGLEAMLRRRFTARQLSEQAQALLQLQALSSQDRNFVESILSTLRRKKRLGAGQIGILQRIGARYGVAASPVRDGP